MTGPAPDPTGPAPDDRRAVEFSRRALLHAGWAVPMVLTLKPVAAAAQSGGGHVDAPHDDHVDDHADHDDHADAPHDDAPHDDAPHDDAPHDDHADLPHFDHADDPFFDVHLDLHSDFIHLDAVHVDI